MGGKTICFDELSQGEKMIDLIGQKFGRLTVIKRDYNDPRSNKHPMWLCKCKCGTIKTISGVSLREGHAKSCSCLRREWMRLTSGLASMRKVICSYKVNAKIRKHFWELTEKQFIKITQQDCHYCGAKPNNISKDKGRYGSYSYNGLDRVDNTKGYTIDNVVSCCKICNRAKSELTLQEFQNWIKRTYNKIFIT